MAINLRLAIGVPLALLVVPAVEAQERMVASRGMLVTTIEVQQLVERGRPGDHVRLRDHFLALTDRYAAEADRDLATSKLFATHARMPISDPGAQWTRNAARAATSADLTRALAEHHERLALGLPSRVPMGGGRFEKGFGAPEPSARHLRHLSASARTGAEHRLLAMYLSETADRHSAEADTYTALAMAYRGNANRRTPGGDPAVHCDRQARRAREAAMNTAGLALEHAKLASASMQ